ncbi:MAG: hypothetical protein J6T84_01115 [Spirochaetaceae bacterium]|nr:hypothetical protein [Spirochaetaceae bacterium]
MEKIFNWIEKNDKKILIISAILGIMFFFFLNCITPYIIDDYCRMYDYSTITELTNIKDAFNSIKTEYFMWNGRSLSTIIITFFVCLKNKIPFNIANTAVYFLFLYLIYSFINKNTKLKSLYFITLFICFWLFTPAYGHDYIWLTGSVTYLWSTIFLLLFIIPYKNKLEGKQTSNILTFLAIPLGFIAGWSVENGAAAILFFLIAYFIRKIIIKEKLKAFEILGFIAFFAGFLFLILSPGSRNRSSQINASSYTTLFQFIHATIKRAYYITLDACKELSFLLITSAIVLLELIIQKKFKFIHFLYILSTFASVYSMVLSPVFPHRAYLFAVIFLILFIFDGFSLIKIEEQGKRFITAALIVCTVVFIHSATISTLDIFNTRQRWNERIHIIEEGKANGKMDYEFKIIHSGERHNSQWNLEDLNPYDNIPIAKYYGINTIVGYE